MSTWGIFRVDPPPVQASPHVPIPAQGNAPPLGMIAAKTTAAITRFWMPEAGEPRLSWHQHQQASRDFIAPLVLPTGDQPPPIAYGRHRERVIFEPWIPPWTNAQSRSWGGLVAPLALLYGGQPPRVGTQDAAQRLIAAAWPVVWYPAQTANQNAAVNPSRAADFPPPLPIPWGIWREWISAGAALPIPYPPFGMAGVAGWIVIPTPPPAATVDDRRRRVVRITGR